MDWNHILNWKLLGGSHEFPGEDGGTCINEAAIVAAGFKYRKIGSADDCPACFSRPISGYCIGLNDGMPSAVRQKLLLPFVTRLAGTADTYAVENKRAKYLLTQTVKRVLPILLRSIALEGEARLCESITDDFNVYGAAFSAVADSISSTTTMAAFEWYVDDCASGAALAICAAGNIATEVWDIAVDMLDKAIKLGKQADPIEISLIQSRMDAFKKRALEKAI
jgi:hypothetical protein